MNIIIFMSVLSVSGDDGQPDALCWGTGYGTLLPCTDCTLLPCLNLVVDSDGRVWPVSGSNSSSSCSLGTAGPTCWGTPLHDSSLQPRLCTKCHIHHTANPTKEQKIYQKEKNQTIEYNIFVKIMIIITISRFISSVRCTGPRPSLCIWDINIIVNNFTWSIS